jgi:FHS family L-fucose permease-like MFS transporter
VVIAVAFLFMRTPLPEIAEDNEDSKGDGEAGGTVGDTGKPLLKRRYFVSGVAAQFAYVAAQTGIFSYMINFVTDPGQAPRFDNEQGPFFLAIGFALSWPDVCREAGDALSGTRPYACTHSLICCLLLPVVSANLGWLSLICLFGVFFFMSIMFPTIFAPWHKRPGSRYKKGILLYGNGYRRRSRFPASHGTYCR